MKELVRGESDEWSELLPLVEFMLDTSPGPHGYCPRDLERAWSLGFGLEKDLIREAMQFEPMSDWSRRQFGQFSVLAKKVQKHWEQSSEARAKLANRYRRSVDLKPGDRVVWHSRTSRPEGAGRVPWRRGLSGPWEIVSVHGNKLVLRSVPGITDKDRQGPFEAHAEDCVIVPGDVEERLPVVELDLSQDAQGAAPSLGQRMHGQGEQYEFVMQRRGRQFVLRIGDSVAYTRGAKVCKLGRVTQVSVAEGTIGVHVYRPLVGSLRVKWVLAYLDEHGEVSADGTRPSLDQVRLKEVITKADISKDGVLAAATSRKLDKAGYRLHEDAVGIVETAELRGVQPVAGVLVFETPPSSVVAAQGPVEGLHRWLIQHGRASKVVFLEIGSETAMLTSVARSLGLVCAPAVNGVSPSYGRSWDLTQLLDQELVSRLVEWLEPLVIHIKLPSERSAGPGADVVAILKGQQDQGRLGTLEVPLHSEVVGANDFVSAFGPLRQPAKPWNVVRVDQCQYGSGVEGAQLWLANYDLSELSARCGRPDALSATEHVHDSGRSDDQKGDYTSVCCSTYWRLTKQALLARNLQIRNLKRLDSSSFAAAPIGFPVDARSLKGDVFAASGGGSADARDMEAAKIPDQDVNVGPDLSPRSREKLEQELAELHQRMTKLWDERASKGDWDGVKADLAVYRLSGQEVVDDPRRTPEYRKQVVDGLGFGVDATPPTAGLNADDLGACRDVLSRKAAAFWLEGTPRTTVRSVAHDCVPTGPPVSLQPHSLKGESAAWVDERLEEEVQRGQLVRGASAWGSPPFPTKEAPAHKRSRKRRLVVDYRRVNAQVLRSTYYCRKATDVLSQCAGSIWYSFVDAVTGFNQIQNTRRAMEVLAIVARSGKFLPVCLTFGPVNGPDDFSYVVDRAFGPGRGRQMKYTKEWIAYVDDLTVRTGRVIDKKFMTDKEFDEEIKRAMRASPVGVGQPPKEAMDALGIKPGNVGSTPKVKHDEKESDHNHPTRAVARSVGWLSPTARFGGRGSRVVLGFLVARLVRSRWLVGSRWLSGSRCGFPQLFGSKPSFRVGSGLGEQVGCRVVRFASCRRTGTPKQWKPIAGQVSVSRPDREAAGRVCGSPLDRGTMASWKKAHRGRRNPQKNWGDLEYALTRALRHGEYGMRGQLQADGWAPIRLVADRVGVSVEDVRRSVEWQSRGPKVRLESLGDWVRALQGHSSDSGLRPHDFTSKVSPPGSTRLLHGTFKERVAGIAEKGLLAGGTGRVGEGRLFVHWSANAGRGRRQ